MDGSAGEPRREEGGGHEHAPFGYKAVLVSSIFLTFLKTMTLFGIIPSSSAVQTGSHNKVTVGETAQQRLRHQVAFDVNLQIR